MKPFLYSIFVVLFVFLQPLNSRAEIQLYQDDTLTLEGGLDIAMAGFQTSNTNFGGGLETPGGRQLKNVGYWEGFALPSAGAEIALPEASALYGGVAWVLSMTGGDGDPGGSTFGHPRHIDNERLFIGWRSGEALGSKDWLDISWGRQDFEIGDGFLVADGNNEGLGKSAILLGPRTAFESAGLIRINTQPLRADIFHLQSDSDYDDPKLYGLNLEWHDDRYGVLGLYGFKIYQANRTSTRDGLLTLAMRGDLHPLINLGWPNATLAFEAAWQHNDRPQRKTDALGWYVTLGYEFNDMPWQPRLAYRYSHFSGDDPDTTTNEVFDPLFVGGPGFGTWFQGEIVAQYLITNSNLSVHSLHLTAQPTPSISTGMIYFHNRLNQKRIEETTVTAKGFAQEIDIYAEFTLNDYVSFTPLIAVAWPGKAAEEFYGGDQTYGLIEGFLTLSF